MIESSRAFDIAIDDAPFFKGPEIYQCSRVGVAEASFQLAFRQKEAGRGLKGGQVRSLMTDMPPLTKFTQNKNLIIIIIEAAVL